MSKTILIVDDKIEEKEKARKIYADAGLRVLTASSYEEANKLLELVDFIVTDLTFPMHSDSTTSDSEVGDFGLAILLRAKRLKIPCFICTNSSHHGKDCKRGLIETMIKITESPQFYTYKKNWSCFLEDINILCKE